MTNKPNTRIVDYAVLIQDAILTIDEVPTDIKTSVTEILRYFAGVSEEKGNNHE